MADLQQGQSIHSYPNAATVACKNQRVLEDGAKWRKPVCGSSELSESTSGNRRIPQLSLFEYACLPRGGNSNPDEVVHSAPALSPAQPLTRIVVLPFRVDETGDRPVLQWNETLRVPGRSRRA